MTWHNATSVIHDTWQSKSTKNRWLLVNWLIWTILNQKCNVWTKNILYFFCYFWSKLYIFCSEWSKLVSCLTVNDFWLTLTFKPNNFIPLRIVLEFVSKKLNFPSLKFFFFDLVQSFNEKNIIKNLNKFFKIGPIYFKIRVINVIVRA